MQANANRPKIPDLLQAERRMSWIGFEDLEILVGEFSNRVWQLAVVMPEF
jgi:hypothetical protein